jgi:hypothetical protein
MVHSMGSREVKLILRTSHDCMPPPLFEAVKSEMVRVQGHTLQCNVQGKNVREITEGNAC